MNQLKIFSDANLSESAFELLKDGVQPLELVLPAKPAASVLALAEPDPAFATAEIAFGQPDIESVLSSRKLRWLQLSSAGYTRYDTPQFREAAKERGLFVTNSSSVYDEACADHVFSFMLAQSRRLPVSLATRLPNTDPRWMDLRNSYVPLRGSNVLILGYGAIAKKLRALLSPFETRITGFRRKPRGDEGVPVVTAADLPAALEKADHVVNILPGSAATDGFLSKERFHTMKPGAVFYNIGRGSTVDQEALYEALHSGHLDAAWLDVCDPEPLPKNHPLLTLKNCFITPHTAGGHRNESATLVRHFLLNLRNFLDEEPLVDRIF